MDLSNHDSLWAEVEVNKHFELGFTSKPTFCSYHKNGWFDEIDSGLHSLFLLFFEASNKGSFGISGNRLEDLLAEN